MRRGERGSAPIELVWLTILLLVPVVYVLVAVMETQRAAYGVSSASQAAARAFVRAPDVTAAEQRALAAARVALADQGVDDADVRITCLPSPRACLQPGSRVRVVVRTTAALPLTPTVLGDQVGPITVDSAHTEPYGSYRAAR